MQSKAEKVKTLGQIAVWKKFAAIAGLAGFAIWLAGCTSVAQSKPQGPVQVSVAEVACRQFGETDEFTGRLEAVHTVEVRPRVSGHAQLAGMRSADRHSA